MLKAIKKVWASYFSPSAGGYSSSDARRYEPVLIQQMIQCDKSGVLFTLNPVNLNKEITIECTEKKNAGIISGNKTAVRYTVKDNKIYKSSDILTGKELKKIINTAQSLENDTQYPCDIEWGIKNGELYILSLIHI